MKKDKLYDLNSEISQFNINCFSLRSSSISTPLISLPIVIFPVLNQEVKLKSSLFQRSSCIGSLELSLVRKVEKVVSDGSEFRIDHDGTLYLYVSNIDIGYFPF